MICFAWQIEEAQIEEAMPGKFEVGKIVRVPKERSPSGLALITFCEDLDHNQRARHGGKFPSGVHYELKPVPIGGFEVSTMTGIAWPIGESFPADEQQITTWQESV
jgi:hypothetical protein